MKQSSKNINRLSILIMQSVCVLCHFSVAADVYADKLQMKDSETLLVRACK